MSYPANKTYSKENNIREYSSRSIAVTSPPDMNNPRTLHKFLCLIHCRMLYYRIKENQEVIISQDNGG